MLTPRSVPRWLAATAAVLLFPALCLGATEVSGTIKSIDAPGKKIVLAPTKGDERVEITVTSSTVYETAKGKAPKKFSLDRLSVGGRVDVTYDKDKGVASKVVLGKGAKKKKNK